jgi:hypothetical protein
VVTGPSGAGKTVVAARLARGWDLPHIELDALYHAEPDHAPHEWAALRETVRDQLSRHPGGWIFDGSYDGVMDLLLGEADAVTWLRLPFTVAYPRLVRRTLRRARSKELLWGVYRERWSNFLRWDSALGWGLILWRGHHRKTRARLRAARPETRILVLRSPREVAQFLARAQQRPGSGRAAQKNPTGPSDEEARGRSRQPGPLGLLR